MIKNNNQKMLMIMIKRPIMLMMMVMITIIIMNQFIHQKLAFHLPKLKRWKMMKILLLICKLIFFVI
ncbi:hypothetical protein BLA29_015258 [Euroglyphus maynei]|uniref:Uncharacterized protein n=1 Tax=Euroglyphus maynei TaxID=6958 RepID=A0A1Y3ARK8_EURMA|nr:hypothetical protein BLA29_015258 [Euroglyphus maynei]